MTNPERTPPSPDPQPLGCPEMVELLTAYLDGALSAEETVSFETHLGLCPGCTIYLEQFRETIRVTGTLGEDDIEPSVMDELLVGFRHWRQGPRQGSTDDPDPGV